MKEYLERGTNLEVNQVEAQEQEEYLSLSPSPSLLPQSRLSLSLWGKIEGKEMVALLLLVLKHDDEAASSDPHLPSSALPAKYALESLSLSPLYYY